MRSLTKQKQPFGSMEPCKVVALEKYMDDFIEINSKHKKIVSLNVKSQNLLKVSYFIYVLKIFIIYNVKGKCFYCVII